MRYVLIVAAVAFLLAVIPAIWWLFQVCFNAVVHGVFGGPEITYWQAAACVVLLGFLGRVFRGSTYKAADK